MKKYFILTFCVLTFACSSQRKTVNKPLPVVTDFQNTITEEGLYIDLAFLASDSLRGRDTGSEGERIAAEYLATRYREFGLSPISISGSYYQPFELGQTIVDSIQYKLTLNDELLNQSTHSPTKIGGFISLLGEQSMDMGGIVFVGYGIDDIEAGINHFNIDVTGKWLLTFYDRSISSFATMQRLIRDENALGAILIMDSEEDTFLAQATESQSEFGIPTGFELLYLNEENNQGSYTRINPVLAQQLLDLASLEALSDLEASIKENPTNFSPYTINASFSHHPSISNVKVQTKNVGAFLEGTDPILKDEVIVLTSHYDHVGVSSPDSTGDVIYNGADDDGSGTVGVLHAAHALATAKLAGAEIKRSILFLHVSGEERGLLGSRYYSDHPIFPIEKTIANLNVDMIGRRDSENANNPDYVYIIGGKIISSGLQTTLEEANEMSVDIQLSDRYNDINDPNQFYRRSDHWNFGRLGVPFIFFFNGTHADYHRPSDEVDKIDFEALQKRTQLLFMTASLLANTESRPEVDNQEFIERTRQ